MEGQCDQQGEADGGGQGQRNQSPEEREARPLRGRVFLWIAYGMMGRG
jgi:hypothetical protein